MNLFLDMDGVLADFDQSFVDTFGVDHREGMTKKEMWKLINGHDEFFYNLPLMPGAKDLFEFAFDAYAFNRIDGLYILTSAGSSNYAHIATQKKRWVRKHFGFVPVLPVREGLDKPLFIQNPGDILVDDWKKNTEAWELAGGTAVKYENAPQAIKDTRGALLNAKV